MRRPVLITCIVALALPGIAGACSGSSDASPSTSSTTSTVPATTVSHSPTSAPTTTLARATRGATTSKQAAASLVAAWNNHDKAAAALIADAAAVEGIFATPDPAMWIRGCSTDDSLPQQDCVYRTRSGLVQINTEHRDIGWVVSSANYDAFDDGGLPPNSGDAPDGPPPTTTPPATSAPAPG